MLRPVTCMRSQAAAAMFYGSGCFICQGAMPQTVLRLLQDKGSVQLLDCAAHRHRKAMFVNRLMGEEAERGFLDLFRQEWQVAIARWSAQQSIVLLDCVNLVLTRAVCWWAGVPLHGSRDIRLCRNPGAMVEYTGDIGPRMLVALARRRSTERFVLNLVQKLRAEDERATPAGRIAHFRIRKGTS
nr:hypothetical protein [Paracoccus saliphilus]